jgi:hypothetical protein
MGLGTLSGIQTRSQRREDNDMASGKQIGEFSFKAITLGNSPGPAGSVLIHVNWEGTASGFGAVFSTSTYVGGPKKRDFQ